MAEPDTTTHIKRPAPLTPDELAAFPLMEGVGLEARRELLGTARDEYIDADAVLIRQSEPNKTMYLLVEGALGVHLNSIANDPVAVIEPGGVVGEMSLLDGGHASAFVVARTPCRLLAVSEEAFWNLTNASHGFAVQLLIKLVGRLRANNHAVTKTTEKTKLYERAAMFDGLTGIHNRRWLDDTLNRLVARQHRGGGPLSLTLLDIDHFKSFNDTYGHECGDHVLSVVAKVIGDNMRPTDLVARYGGEEFVIIYPETPLDLAAVAANRVRVAVAATELKMPDGRELPRVTISMGVSQLEPDQDVAGVLKAADSAMYRAKHAGRNRVMTGTKADIGKP